MDLSIDQGNLLSGAHGESAAIAMRILLDMAHVEGVSEFVQVSSVHVDGCLMHGATGCYYAEKLQSGGGRVRVPTSLNVGAMDLVRPENVLLKGKMRDLAIRQMNAYVAMGCTPSWTCAPYQAGFRPALGEQVAWAESNAVVFANSVLGARTNRYSDFLDICCALTGYAPCSGLHITENRYATILINTSLIPAALKLRDDFYPVLGAWLGREVGTDIAVIDGLPVDTDEDRLKSLGAAAASTGAVGLFHAAGITPEAETVAQAMGDREPAHMIELTPDMLLATHRQMSTTSNDEITVVALGSPHFSMQEFTTLLQLLGGRRSRVPIYACTGRHVLDVINEQDLAGELEAANVRLITDTCVVVTPVIEMSDGVLMTNSGKFAHYSPSLIGHEVVFGSLSECVESAVAGSVVRDHSAWGLA
jgi:predicted aconitase